MAAPGPGPPIPPPGQAPRNPTADPAQAAGLGHEAALGDVANDDRRFPAVLEKKGRFLFGSLARRARRKDLLRASHPTRSFPRNRAPPPPRRARLSHPRYLDPGWL